MAAYHFLAQLPLPWVPIGVCWENLVQVPMAKVLGIPSVMGQMTLFIVGLGIPPLCHRQLYVPTDTH